MPVPTIVIPAASTMEVQIVGTLFGQITRTTFHYSNLTEIPDWDLVKGAYGQAIRDEVMAKIVLAQSTTWEARHIRLQWVLPTRYVAAFYDTDLDNGLNAGTVNQCGPAWVIKRTGTVANRHNQGRVFIPAIPNENIDAGEITQAFVDNFGPDIELALKSQIEPEFNPIIEPVLLNRAGGAMTVIASAEATRVVRYQRRRELRVGE